MLTTLTLAASLLYPLTPYSKQATLDTQNKKFALINALSGKCMDVRDHGTAVGSVLQQWECFYGDNQLYTISLAGRYGWVVSGVESYRNIGASSSAALSPVVLNLTSFIQIEASSQHEGAYLLRSASGAGQCIELADASLEDGAALQVRECDGSAQQLWFLQESNASAL